jgi:small subunit ribosomal protein S2
MADQDPKDVASDTAVDEEKTEDTAEDAPAADADAEVEDAPSDDVDAEDANAEDAVDEEADDSDEDGVEEDVVAEEDEDDEDDEDDASENGEAAAHRSTIEELLKAGSHFGHLTSRWDPRMKKYIFMDRNNIHIIDLMQTQVLLDKAADAARRFARRGKKILFTGTKKQAQEIVREHAESCDMPFMVQRWMGGTMTNFQTIRRSIRRMEDIERMEKEGTLDKLKKKEKLMRMREHEKLEATLGGIRNMANLPGAIFIVDVKREHIAVSEARKLGIPIIAMVDTNGDPREIDYPIPANDDALSSIELVTSTITEAIHEGLQERKAKQDAKQKQQA